MRTLLFAVLSGAALSLATVAFADDTKPATPVSADDSDKQICKPVTHEGQLVGKTCHTQKEWDKIRYQDQERLRQYQQQSLFQHPM
jgi:hypothetical protein